MTSNNKIHDTRSRTGSRKLFEAAGPTDIDRMEATVVPARNGKSNREFLRAPADLGSLQVKVESGMLHIGTCLPRY